VLVPAVGGDSPVSSKTSAPSQPSALTSLGNKFAEVLHHRDAEAQSFFDREGSAIKMECDGIDEQQARPAPTVGPPPNGGY
jgi:hypothetical protein